MSYMVSNRETALQQKINAIQDALRQIEVIKQKLRENANKTTSHIQTAVSRQLETLRNREVWLCEQVQLLQATKQDTLNKQTSELIETLGQLESCLQCVSYLDMNTPHSQHQLANLNKAAEDCIARFDSLELSAREDPYLSFRGDISALRACIQRFGTIDSKTVCAAVFGGDMQKSASLPRALEEYEDEEHHVLYKPLQPNAPTMVSMRVPKHPSVRPEDWLFLPPDVAAPPEPEAPAARPVHVQQWLARHKLQASASTHQWLNEIQGQCANEEEGYDTLAQGDKFPRQVSVSSDIEVLHHDDFASQMSDDEDDFEAIDTEDGQGKGEEHWAAGVCRYFEQVLEQPSSAWLVTSDAPTTNCPYLKMKFFSEVSDNLKDWLQKFDEEMKEDEDKDVCCGEGSCTPASDNTQVDIENLYELACVTPKQSPKQPAKHKHQVTKQHQQLEWVLTKGVADICMANEPCQTFSECVNPDNCCSESSHQPKSATRSSLDKNRKPSIPTMQQWLRLPAEMTSSSEAAVPDTYQQQLTKSLCVSESKFDGSNGSGSYNEWLSKPSQKLLIENESESGFSSPGSESPFHRPLSAFSATSLAKSDDSAMTRLSEDTNSETDKWLKKRVTGSSHNSLESHPYNRKSDLAGWLKATRQYTEKLNAEKENSKWLKTPEKVSKSIGKVKSYSFDAGWLSGAKKNFEKSEKCESKGVVFPNYEADISWLLEDKLNIKSEKAPFEICGKIPKNSSFQKFETNKWLQN